MRTRRRRSSYPASGPTSQARPRTRPCRSGRSRDGGGPCMRPKGPLPGYGPRHTPRRSHPPRSPADPRRPDALRPNPRRQALSLPQAEYPTSLRRIEVEHLNCGTMCPRGARQFTGQGGLLETTKVVAHCLLIEAGGELILVDTGFGLGDCSNPNRLGRPFRAMSAPICEERESAVRQIEALGHDPADVRPIPGPSPPHPPPPPRPRSRRRHRGLPRSADPRLRGRARRGVLAITEGAL